MSANPALYDLDFSALHTIDSLHLDAVIGGSVSMQVPPSVAPVVRRWARVASRGPARAHSPLVPPSARPARLLATTTVGSSATGSPEAASRCAPR